MSTTGFSLARRLRAGETVYTGWCAMPAPLVAENVARAGFTSVVLDQQHGMYEIASTVAAIGPVRLAGAAAVVRVPLNDFASASRALDIGAEAVIAPMINTVELARGFVGAMKYPPVGERSWGPARAAALAGIAELKDYFRDANGQTLALAMIETREAIANVDAIAATDGIDGLFVGPFDLSIALSNGAVLDPYSKDVDAALDVILAAAAKHKKIPGIYCANAEAALAAAKRGFKFIAVGGDVSYLRAGVAQQLKALGVSGSSGVSTGKSAIPPI
ncbi:MAG TPA: aldolase/citrate lyase family protein [Pseudorhodoplanes sp.]|nr:aldolase/citrate lyase family protein [Pseudorhodoplanes sp.]